MPADEVIPEEAAAGAMPEHVLDMRGITIRFGPVVANEAVDFQLRAGEIHALLGENGAGKTTLMRVLAGLVRADGGEVLLHGRPQRYRSPADAADAGIGMVHQHFMLVPSMTVAENVCLGLPSAGRVFPDVARVARELAELSRRHGLDLDPHAKVERLSVGQQQRVEIVKALHRRARILILDEPTAVLTPGEADSLLAVLRSLAAQGTGIVFISHKLREVMAVADRVTVLRRGRRVGTCATADVTAAELAALMVGREVRVPDRTPRPAADGPPVLELSGAGLVDRGGVVRLDDVSLTVRAGEILGIAGVDGNGQRELTRAVCGLQRLTSGRIRIRGTDVTADSAARRIAAGLAHVPEDRQHTGLVLELTIAENAALEVMAQEPVSRRGWLRPKAMRAAAEQLVRDYDIRCSGPDQPVRELSGGNQQKVLLAREVAREPAVLVVSQPTRGLDIGAIEYVHGQLRALRDRGCAVLLVSTELDEILELSDRVAVLYGGRVMSVTDRADVRLDELGLHMAGRPAGAR
ncbi:Monosaccharide-transporting ATPase [Actinobacteria bacterium OK074]|nr:Monosaccharide-transporting ATPase [Actinobacteria bacterium OK074]